MGKLRLVLALKPGTNHTLGPETDSPTLAAVPQKKILLLRMCSGKVWAKAALVTGPVANVS